MNKSLLTNLIAAAILFAGYVLPNPTIMAIGLFAVSGAITNWLAVYMLFDKVPGLYGSGVIPLHFDDFRAGIRNLMMNQFFTTDNIERFLSDSQNNQIDLTEVVDSMDLSPTFDGLVKTIEESSFGGMLSMIGGADGLSGLKQPFIKRMKSSLTKIASSDRVQQAIHSGLQKSNHKDAISDRISEIIEKRLEELTPETVKQIIQDMIRKHLGWLVVWGGVLGGLIGFLSTLVNH
ncbi:MAG: DUF445 family protein [Arenicellales bacterium]